jgi:hypothetical protein
MLTMNLLQSFLAIVGIFAAASVNAGDKSVPSYITGREIMALAPCTGTFVKTSEFSGTFTTVEGKKFVLGSPAGEQEVWHFLGTLKEKQACTLPAAFINYTTARYYVTAKAIAAMPPCTATLVQRSPCSSYFTTADGKGFGIGDPGRGPRISHFIWSLKDGQVCKFPEAFLAYQQENKGEDKE